MGDVYVSQLRSMQTIRDCTTIFHTLWTPDGILEIRTLTTAGPSLFIVVYENWRNDALVIPFGEGIIVRNKFRWLYNPVKQYAGRDVTESSTRVQQAVEWFINKDS